jgi:hypothetical protein
MVFVKKPNPEQSGDGKPWVPILLKSRDRQVAMEKTIISRSIDPAGLFQLILTPRQAFLPPLLSSEHYSQKHNVGHPRYWERKQPGTKDLAIMLHAVVCVA